MPLFYCVGHIGRILQVACKQFAATAGGGGVEQGEKRPWTEQVEVVAVRVAGIDVFFSAVKVVEVERDALQIVGCHLLQGSLHFKCGEQAIVQFHEQQEQYHA